MTEHDEQFRKGSPNVTAPAAPNTNAPLPMTKEQIERWRGKHNACFDPNSRMVADANALCDLALASLNLKHDLREAKADAASWERQADELMAARRTIYALQWAQKAAAAKIAVIVVENENLQAYAKHERALGAEGPAIELNDCKQQLATARAQERERIALVFDAMQYTGNMRMAAAIVRALTDEPNAAGQVGIEPITKPDDRSQEPAPAAPDRRARNRRVHTRNQWGEERRRDRLDRRRP